MWFGRIVKYARVDSRLDQAPAPELRAAPRVCSASSVPPEETRDLKCIARGSRGIRAKWAERSISTQRAVWRSGSSGVMGMSCMNGYPPDALTNRPTERGKRKTPSLISQQGFFIKCLRCYLL